MEDPNIKVEIIHSRNRPVWKIINTALGKKRDVAEVSYLKIEGDSVMTEVQRSEALRHAKFIQFCFDNSEEILKTVVNEPS